MRATGQFQRHVNSGMLFHTCPPFAMSGRINRTLFPILSGDSCLTAHSEQGPLRHLTHMNAAQNRAAPRHLAQVVSASPLRLLSLRRDWLGRAQRDELAPLIGARPPIAP
jgi:hypothetical protein